MKSTSVDQWIGCLLKSSIFVALATFALATKSASLCLPLSVVSLVLLLVFLFHYNINKCVG